MLNAGSLSIDTVISIHSVSAAHRDTDMGREGRGYNHENTGYRAVRVLSVASASLLYHSKYGTEDRAPPRKIRARTVLRTQYVHDAYHHRTVR